MSNEEKNFIFNLQRFADGDESVALPNNGSSTSTPSDGSGNGSGTGSSDTTGGSGTTGSDTTSDSDSTGTGSSTETPKDDDTKGTGSETTPTEPPTITFTELDTNKAVFLQGSEKAQLVLEEYFNKFTASNITSSLKLTANDDSAVAFNTVFDSIKVTVHNQTATEEDVVKDVPLAENSFDILSNVSRLDGAHDTVTIEFNVKDDVHGDYKLIYHVADAKNSVENSSTFAVKVITAEEALTHYEDLVQEIASSDLDEIAKQKDALEASRITASEAISALEDGDKKTSLQSRYDAAYLKQKEAYKLYYLYKSKNNHLDLYKVKHISGNVPFRIVFTDKIKVGSAKRVFYYNAGQYDEMPVSDLTPDQTSLLFGTESMADGDYDYIYEMNDGSYYHTVITVKDNLVSAVDDFVIPTEKIKDKDTVYTVPGKEVDKTTLNELITSAEKLNSEHVVGEDVGTVKQEAKDAFTSAIDKAKVVNNNDEAQSSEVKVAVEELTTAIQNFKDAIEDYKVDKTAIEKAISDYQTHVDAVQVGTKPGNTTQENIDTFKAAIKKAKEVSDSVSSKEEYSDTDKYNDDVKKLSDALAELNKAKETFDNGIITNDSYAESQVAAYEKAAIDFLNSIRKKIRI